MPEFEIGKEIVTAAPSVEVTGSGANSLLPGVHRFQLVVEDDAGNVSNPMVLDVLVQASVLQRPVAVMALIGDQPRLGSPFTLDASGSSDPLDRGIVEYRWTLSRTAGSVG
jgi:hypothetical protein